MEAGAQGAEQSASRFFARGWTPACAADLRAEGTGALRGRSSSYSRKWRVRSPPCPPGRRTGRAKQRPMRTRPRRSPRPGPGRRICYSPDGEGFFAWVQLEASRLRFRFGQVKMNDHNLFWSAATCRRYGPGVGRKAATSRRTPYRTRHLSVFCAHPAGSLTPTSNSLCSAHLTAFAIRCHPKGRTRGLGTKLIAETMAELSSAANPHR